MKLDIHTHILPGDLPNLQERYGCPGWINIRKDPNDPNVANMYKDDVFFRRIERNCMCIEERCVDMKKTNVNTQVLSTVPVMFNYSAKPEHTADLSRLLNDDIAMQIRQHEEKEKTSYDLGNGEILKQFYGFGTIPMQSAELAVDEMTRCMKDLGFKGIQIGTNVKGMNLDDKSFYPIWKVIYHNMSFSVIILGE
jgi:aminocarboxymuconate-semialdehyde decarboxylase